MAENGKHYFPAKEKTDIYARNHVFRTCAYCRVSTDSDGQKDSFEIQKEHYEQLAGEHTNWDLRHVFADEGISGLSLKKRDQFNEMIAACLRGEYDLILTKSVSRFARNLVDCISLARKLKDHNPPIGIFFETDNLFTLAEDSELKLSILATMAQEESIKKSESMVWSLQQRFKNERLLMPECYGYSREKDLYGRYVRGAKLEVVEDEARVVRFIYDAFLAGMPLASIAEILSEAGVATKTGAETWTEGSLRYILTNERYCGNVLTWKTFTANIFEHKKRKNRQDRDQYLYENVHEAIIPAEKFEAVQTLLENRKHGVRAYPQMYVIENGVFRGYVPVNHHWVNDDPNSYYEASNCAANSAAKVVRPRQIRRSAFSAFDLRGYQVVRGQFLTSRAEVPGITVTPERMSFNTVCMQKFGEVDYVQLLIHPSERRIAIRPCRKEDPHSIRWNGSESSAGREAEGSVGSKGAGRETGAGRGAGRKHGKTLRCPYFAAALYQILEWDPAYHYRVRGVWASRPSRSGDASGVEQIITFSMDDATPMARLQRQRADGSTVRKLVEFCPEEWADGFGEEFYQYCLQNPLTYLRERSDWDTQAESRPVGGQLRMTTETELRRDIAEIRGKVGNVGNGG